MNILKQQVRKYAFLLAGIYVIARIIATIIEISIPHILDVEYAPHSYRFYSTDDVVFVISLFGNILIALSMLRDMKRSEIFIWPLLVLAFIYPIYSVIFYLIIVYATILNPKQENA